MVSAWDSRPGDVGVGPGLFIMMCSWAKHSTFTVPLYNQEGKKLPANCQNLVLDWEKLSLDTWPLGSTTDLIVLTVILKSVQL